jgi:hypothetical protein
MAEVIEKFRDCTLGRLSPEQANHAIDCVIRLRSADSVGSLIDALGPNVNTN